jgi:glycosyltransferase involved in cell wall biosynthesis
LIIAGDGPLDLYLQRLARHLGIIDRVVFHHWQTGAALVQAFQNAAVVAIPSLYEPFGIVALEAMACGRPPVASNTGGLAEIVENGADGYLVAPGDHLDLARRMLWLVKNPDRSRHMGERARQKALGYSWTSAARQTADLCSTVRYSGEAWSASADARAAVESLYETLDDRHRELLTEATGVGVDS